MNKTHALPIFEANSPSVQKTFIHFKDISEAKCWVDAALTQIDAEKKLEFAIKLPDHTFIGLIGLHFIDEFSAEIGLWIRENFQNLGFGRAALKACIDLVFEKYPKIQLLIYKCGEWNIPSIKLAKSLNFQFKHLEINDEWGSLRVYHYPRKLGKESSGHVIS